MSRRDEVSQYRPIPEANDNEILEPLTCAKKQNHSARNTLLGVSLVILLIVSIGAAATWIHRTAIRGSETLAYHDERLEKRVFHQATFEESSKIWDCLPNGNGLIYLNITKGEDIPQGLPSQDGKMNLYGVSWIHQMYCLSVIRNEHYFALGDVDFSILQKETEAMRKQIIEECFEYLRQKIFCLADMSIEYPSQGHEHDGNNHDRITGFHMEHQCKIKVYQFPAATCLRCR